MTLKTHSVWQLTRNLALCTFAASAAAFAQTAPLCTPVVSDSETVVSAAQRQASGSKAIPPITDTQNGFAWPDSEFGVMRTAGGYSFFASDGGHHTGNNKYGSVVRTEGSLDNPLGSAPPIDVIVHPNPDSSVNPNYPNYNYLGGGRIYGIPPGSTGAGSLLDVYHAEINTATSFYSLLGMALSSDGGAHWTDLGEIVRPNQPYQSDLAGFDIGSPRLVPSPDGQYFYIYFPDWIANGTTQPATATLVSVARAPVSAVLAAATDATPHAAAFQKYYQGAWSQAGIGGLSTDLDPTAAYGGSSNVAFNESLQRYVRIADDTQHISYSESADGLTWSTSLLLAEDQNSQTSFNYAVPIGTGGDPNVLGMQFFVYFTFGSLQGWPDNTVQRFTATCE